MNGDWQPAALYGGLALLVICLFWRWNRSNDQKIKNFSLLHFVTNREGFVDPDRAFLTGSFLVSTFAVVVAVIRNAITADVVLLVGGYASVFALKSAWGYTVAKRTDTTVKTEEIRRGRMDDEVDIDLRERDESQRSTPRRRSTDSVFK